MNVLTDAEFADLLQGFEHTAFRLELQRAYSEPDEHDTVARFLAGDQQEPTEVAGLRAWFAQVAQQTRQGKRIERVRVHDNPLTDYQRWERWIGAWNTEAGEAIGYMTRDRAHEIGLLPGVGTVDWWLLDSVRLIVMSFDDQGHRLTSELVTEPYRVVQACAWRDLAIHYSAPDEGWP
jgi:hypothetical protein